MFSCSVCDKTFPLIRNLHGHAKSHKSPTKVVCSICSEIFTRRDNLIRHNKEKHRSNIIIQQQPTITKREIQDFFKPAEQIYDYDVQFLNGHKHPYHKENSNEAANAKKARLLLVQSPTFTEILFSEYRKVDWYYVKNIENIQNCIEIFNLIKSELVELLKSLASKHPIKFNLKLEATYNIPNVDNSSENCSFKTSPRVIFSEICVREIVEEGIIKLMAEQDEYFSKGSGYTLQCIGGLLLGVYKYTPMSVSFYIPLPI